MPPGKRTPLVNLHVPRLHYFSGCSLSPDCRKLIAGFAPPASTQNPQGTSFVWLSLHREAQYKELSGGFSAWSNDSDYILTWDPPIDATQRASRSIAFFLWRLSDLSSEATVPEPHRVYKSAKGHNICWCSFIDSSVSESDFYFICCTCAAGLCSFLYAISRCWGYSHSPIAGCLTVQIVSFLLMVDRSTSCVIRITW